MIPTVGRLVHYHSHGSPVRPDGTQKYTPEPRAAIVTAVPDAVFQGSMTVSLAILNPTGLFFDQAVPYSDGPTPGHWSWPPRVPAVRDVAVSNVFEAGGNV